MKLKKYATMLASLLCVSTIVFAQNTNGGTTDPNAGGTTGGGTTQDPNASTNAQDDQEWANPDFRSYVRALDELIKMSDEYAENKLRLALANYQTGKSVIQKMRDEVRVLRERSKEEKHLNEKWYWQTLDRKMREERIIRDKKKRAKMKAVTYYTRAINHLDQIENPKILESDEYKALLANIYREWAMAQYDIGNIPQIIDILNRYIALGPKYEQQVAPHKYLASAYGFQEKVLQKYGGGTEQDLIFFKKMKNKHLLRATELMYKKDSPEYRKMLEIVNRDEILAIQPNG